MSAHKTVEEVEKEYKAVLERTNNTIMENNGQINELKRKLEILTEASKKVINEEPEAKEKLEEALDRVMKGLYI